MCTLQHGAVLRRPRCFTFRLTQKVQCGKRKVEKSHGAPAGKHTPCPNFCLFVLFIPSSVKKRLFSTLHTIYLSNRVSIKASDSRRNCVILSSRVQRAVVTRGSLNNAHSVCTFTAPVAVRMITWVQFPSGWETQEAWVYSIGLNTLGQCPHRQQRSIWSL